MDDGQLTRLLGPGFRSDYATVNGVRLHYVVGGAGEPVVLLHGWPMTWYSWRKVMPALAQRHTVLAPDMRGLGDSERPAAGYEKSTVAEDIHALVQALGLGAVSLVGHDMGVPVAYAYAAQHPAEVRRLAVLDVPINGFGLAEFAQRLHLWHFNLFQTPALPEALLAGRERTLIEHFYPKYAPAAITPIDVDEYARTYTAPGALAASLGYYRAYPADEVWNRERSRTKLELPVLALGGEFAGGSSPFSCFVQLARNVRGGVIPGCGHFVPEEKPDELLAELIPFLQADPAAPAAQEAR